MQSIDWRFNVKLCQSILHSILLQSSFAVRGRLLKHMNFLSNLSLPLRAIISRRFYIDVMFRWRGVGLSYLFVLSAVLALIAVYPVQKTLQSLQNLELANVVAQIPASYVDNQGILHAKQPTNEPLYLQNSKKQLVVLYNPYDAKVDNNAQAAITLTSHAILIATAQGVVTVPWTALYGSDGSDFEPLPVSQLMEETFNSGIVSTWIVVTMWFFSILAFVVLFAALIGKFAALFIFKVHIPFVAALRLAAVGSTLVAFLLLGQFFFAISLSYIFMTLIPVFYMVSFARDVRKIIDRSNADPEFAASEQNPLREWYANSPNFNANAANINSSTSNFNNSTSPSSQASEEQQSQDEGKAFNASSNSASKSSLDSFSQDSLNDPDSQQKAVDSKAKDSLASNLNTENSNVDSSQSKTSEQSIQHDNQSANNRTSYDEENHFAFNGKWDDDEPIFDEDKEYHSGEVKPGRKGEDSSFTP